jgi:thiamine-phosphate pyrophosphorylase
VLLYFITDRRQLGGSEPLLRKIAEAAGAGVDFIQLRERDLTTRELEQLARQAARVVREAGPSTKLLINSRIDVALAAGADGVHLRSDDISAGDARAIWCRSAGRTDCVIGVSCHSLRNVLSAEGQGADFAIYGPVFGKQGSDAQPTGVEGLASVLDRGEAPGKVEASQKLRMPVIALGGVTIANAADCERAGAAGVAAIRMFQENEVAAVVKALKSVG